jgi:hypothetical protein
VGSVKVGLRVRFESVFDTKPALKVQVRVEEGKGGEASSRAASVKRRKYPLLSLGPLPHVRRSHAQLAHRCLLLTINSRN